MVVLQGWRLDAGFHYEWEDDALYHQLLANTAGGQPFTNTIHPLHRPSHLALVLPALWPLYALLGGGWFAVHVLTALIIGAGAVAVFMLARARELTERESLVWAGVYLLFPPTIMLTLGTFRPLALAVTPLLFLIWAFTARRFRTYVSLLVLTLAFREDLAISAGALAIVAAVRGYERRWIVATVAICATWLLVASQLIMPMLTPADYTQAIVHGNLSGGLTDVVLRPFETTHLIAFAAILVPLLGLSLGAWEIAVGAMGFAAIGLNKAGFAGNILHLMAPAVAGAIAGAIVTFSRLPERRRVLLAVCGAVLLAHVQPWIPAVVATETENNGPPATGLETADAWSPFHPRYYRPIGDQRSRQAAAALVPSDASATAVGHLLPLLTPRAQLYEYGHADTPFAAADYLLLEEGSLYNGAGSYIALPPGSIGAHLAALSPAFEVISTQGPVVVLKRTGEAGALSDAVRALLPRRDVRDEDQRGARSPGEELAPRGGGKDNSRNADGTDDHRRAPDNGVR